MAYGKKCVDISFDVHTQIWLKLIFSGTGALRRQEHGAGNDVPGLKLYV
jgi:hypothetical protein